MTDGKCSEAMRPSSVQSQAGSQSLFNIYYLGCTVVDRRCTSAIMPWIIEELKLKAQEMKFIWLSPGQEEVMFVADSGQQLFSHSYANILQCCLAMDGISFAYMAREEKEKYICHVFQAFSYEEASKIMNHFKQHAKEEISLQAPVSDHAHTTRPHDNTLMGGSSAYVLSLCGEGGTELGGKQETSGKPPIRGDTYKLVFLGKYQMPMPVNTGSVQVELIDVLVAKVKEALAARATNSQPGVRKSIGSRLLGRTSKPSPFLRRSSVGKPQGDSDRRASAGDQGGQIGRSRGKEGTGCDDILSSSAPSSMSERRSRKSREKEEDKSSRSGEEQDPVRLSAARTHENGDFDIIPELGNLQQSEEFRALSGAAATSDSLEMNNVEKCTVNVRVLLHFTGSNVLAVAEESTNLVFKKSIKTIACCAQGKKDGEYLAFTSKQGQHNHICYLFVARNSKTAVKVLDSFKTAFVHALSLRMPPATCEYCPMNKIEILCKSLEGVSTQVAQSKLQESLEELSESDYNKIMQHYKVSEHADHEFTQIVVLVTLLRQHFQRLQDKHTHRGLVTSKFGGRNDTRQETRSQPRASDDYSNKLKVPAIARAKHIIANSFENLRSKSSEDQDRRKRSSEGGVAGHTQSLFTRKSSIDTLMSPIHSKSSSVDEETESRLQARRGSWMARATPTPPQLNLDTEDSEEEDRHAGPGDEPGGPGRGPQQSGKGSDEGEESGNSSPSCQSESSGMFPRLRDPVHDRFVSLTPPSSGTEKLFKHHRRAGSHEACISVRQEIFESVVTPSKLERGHRKTTASSDILDEFEIIELNSNSSTAVSGVVEGCGQQLGQDPDEPLTRGAVARRRWRSAIHQQIVLLRMDRQNHWIKVTGKNKLKMYYSNALGDRDPSCMAWKQLLDGTSDSSLIPTCILGGVPATCREEVWQWLSQHYQNAHNNDWTFPKELKGVGSFHRLSQVTTEYEHSIAVDIGRTFPSHPYFSSSLQEGGQADLYRILRAYAAADPETGYCQGLSFVTGIIIIHTQDECSAFAMLYKLMNLHGYKEIYKGSLAHLQVRLYQLSRLILDFLPSLHHLLHVHEVTPFFYAAPWFLTIFASQYPISFAARVFDLIFYEGVEVLFKVALALLSSHQSKLLMCKSMETICNYIKSKIPAHMESSEEQTVILKQAMDMPDLQPRLRLFEAEYEVLHELHNRLITDELHISELEDVREQMNRTNRLMVEQLAICHGAISSLQQTVKETSMQLQLQQNTIARLEAQSRTTPTSPS